MVMDDVKIIQAIKEGDKNGYTQLFKLHYRKVYNYIKQRLYMTTFTYVDYEDLTMISFEKAFEKLDTWKPTYKFSTWLITVAKYTIIDFIKAQAIRVNGTDEIDKFLFIKDISQSPYQELVYKELKALIEGRIDQLAKKSKPVMRLHFEGYSDEQIVEKLNMMHGNVRCILSRAKEKLNPLKTLLYEEDNVVRHTIVA